MTNESKNLKILCYIYHTQVSKGNVTDTIVKNIRSVGFVHFTDVLSRHEPGTGEINLTFVLSKLKKAGYAGNSEFEYSLTNGDEHSISLIREIRIGVSSTS